MIAVAQLLSASLRKVDLVGRIGGEEFSLLIHDTNQEVCERVAQHVRTGVEQLNVPGWTDLHGALTISIGSTKMGPSATLESGLQ
ncbi:MAG: diguanylate cyclase, partial [Burkholderiaceae bacterium]|nr:diguanylate cyclase [Burkholderiaceae bacterium]